MNDSFIFGLPSVLFQIDNVRLIYNFTSRTTTNSPGVTIRVPGFGNTTSVEFLDPSEASPGHYFNHIVTTSLLPLGYVRNETVKGVPYDFRKAPNELHQFFLDFQALVESTYREAGNKSVVLMTHSMGGPMALYLLHRVKQSWKDKYVRAIVTLGAPWGGSVKAWKVFAAGDDLGVYVLPAHTLRGMQRTSPSTAFLLPSTLFWEKDEVLVSVPGKGNYTVHDYERFFHDMEFPEGAAMRQDTGSLMGQLEAPGVEVFCLHGQGVSTVESFYYKEDKYFPDRPSLNYGNGDGTVNIRSLRGCLRWAGKRLRIGPKRRIRVEGTKQSQPVHHQEFPGIDHMEILKDDSVSDYITTVMKTINNIR